MTCTCILQSWRPVKCSTKSNLPAVNRGVIWKNFDHNSTCLYFILIFDCKFILRWLRSVQYRLLFVCCSQSLVLVAIVLNGANLYGYVRCKLGSADEVKSAATSYFSRQMLTSVSSLSLVFSVELYVHEHCITCLSYV